MATILLRKGDGNDPNNPNGMNAYGYKGKIIYAYSVKDVPMRYRVQYGHPRKKQKNGKK